MIGNLDAEIQSFITLTKSRRLIHKDMVVKATRSQRDTIINAAFDVKVTAVGVAIPS